MHTSEILLLIYKATLIIVGATFIIWVFRPLIKSK